MSEAAELESKDGVARIKPEFLVNNLKRTLNLDYVSKKDKEKCSESNEGEPPRKKLKGQNKHRPRDARTPRTQKFCPNMIEHSSCKYGNGCYYIHNPNEFLASKPPDIKDECYLFNTYGKCVYGISCRFASHHTRSDGKNIIDEDKWRQWQGFKVTKNHLQKDVQLFLRRRNYDFSTAIKVIKLIDKSCRLNAKKTDKILLKTHSEVSTFGETSSEKETVLESVGDKLLPDLDKRHVENIALQEKSESCPLNNKIKLESIDNEQVVTCGTLTDEDLIKSRGPEMKKVSFNKKLYLAPLTTVGNLPFRRICKQLGAEITCSEMAMTCKLLQGRQAEWALLKRHHSEKIFGVQICGSHADILTKCSQLLMENTEVDFVDINVGCPLDFVCNKGSGCALMNKSRRFENIVYGMKSVLTVPLTAKIRTGLHENKNTAHTLIPQFRDWGLSLVSIHGRSREQRYTKKADWDYINRCAELAHPMPLFGNGDVLSFEDYYNHLENTTVDGVMIARGALIKPWIFTEIQERRHWDISAQERIDILQDYVNYGLEHWGADTEGVEKTRRFLLEWLSFLYRYIPVGLLEVLPQRINDRPPFYCGRNELETLMSSPNCSDWIKISEMFLGPVPPDFTFLPKHKANSY